MHIRIQRSSKSQQDSAYTPAHETTSVSSFSEQVESDLFASHDLDSATEQMSGCDSCTNMINASLEGSSREEEKEETIQAKLNTEQTDLTEQQDTEVNKSDISPQIESESQGNLMFNPIYSIPAYNPEDSSNEVIYPATSLFRFSWNRGSDSQTGNETIHLSFLQTKLTVGRPGDNYEQEADSMAQRVMSIREPADKSLENGILSKVEEVQLSPNQIIDTNTKSVQMKCSDCGNKDTLEQKTGVEISQLKFTKIQASTQQKEKNKNQQNSDMSVSSMDCDHKLVAAANLVPDLLVGDAKETFRKLLHDPVFLASIATLAAAFIALQEVPVVGPVVDLVLLFLGSFSWGWYLGSYLVKACTAESEDDLLSAAMELKTVVEIVGVAAIAGLIARASKILRTKAGQVGEGKANISEDEAKNFHKTSQDQENSNLSNGNNNKRIPLESDKQGKHIIEHKNFQAGKSKLTYKNPQELIDQFSGKGQSLNSIPIGQPGSRERINFGKVIGNYVDQAAETSLPTTNGIIHYSKYGAHIVPARP